MHMQMAVEMQKLPSAGEHAKHVLHWPTHFLEFPALHLYLVVLGSGVRK